MKQLMHLDAGVYGWSDVAEPTLAGPGSALVRPLAVACCDLDVAISDGRAPFPPGFAQGHEGVAVVLEVGSEATSVRPGDEVLVPFQISCGECPTCRRGVTSSCEAVPPRAMYGLGAIAGQDGGGFLSDAVLVPFADAMLVQLPAGADRVAVASMSDNIPDGWRTVGPYVDELLALADADRRILVVGGLSIGLYAVAVGRAHGILVDYVDTDPARLSIAEGLGARVVDADLPDAARGPYPVTVHTSANPLSLAATTALTWPDGVCTDTGIYYSGEVSMPLLAMYSSGIRFVTGRANARADIPKVLDLLGRGLDLAPIVEQVVPWDEAPAAWSALRGKTVVTRSA
jgi:threonine dehydrogenase-like Zn-dependent dehydrogenase